MSTFAFGTYRVNDENLLHIEALKEAIDLGVRVIETAPYYTDGGAQRAVKKVMQLFEDKIRDEIEIISKCLLPKENDQDIKALIHEQIDASLENLQLLKIESCLIEDCAESSLLEVFTAFEKAVREGKIQSYGMSADSIKDIESVLSTAKEAAQKTGNEEHSFTTLELPVNMLEQENLKTAKEAKKHGLRVLSNRPLNAQKDGLMYRLAEYDEPQEYYHTLNELLEICDNDDLRVLYNLIEQMDANKHKFGFIGEYDTFLSLQILPHIKKAIENIHEDVLDVLLEYIERFLRNYREMVAYESAKMTRTTLKEYFSDCNAKMQECALRFLLQNDGIDNIVISMRQPRYVQEVMALKA
ncbi:aldo/keto reductase [Sulfurimonas paralvinellae]|uniref:Aldo/keto reductase n=1 Tax=Sulfurimonas paralvinellae TaxID=317658 RepID=A0A7M1B5F7_9BACT|nr:aldo/keto reductase [Sulfurimonas paralvinellae]QOP44977.1 aldo/keto reductase [Sulfurimonas paralvinellae]